MGGGGMFCKQALVMFKLFDIIHFEKVLSI